MYQRHLFILISLFASLDLSAMELIVSPAVELQGPRSPDFLAQPLERSLERKVSQEERVLNGHMNCKDPYTLLELGAKKFQNNQFEAARIFWEHALKQAQGDQKVSALAWHYLGYAYYELDQPEKTEVAWKHVANQEADFFLKADARYNLFSLFAFQGKEKEAHEEYDALKKLLFNAQPRDNEPFHEADALFYLSGVCECGGELEEAVKYYDLTQLHLERMAWLHHDTTTRVQALKYLTRMAKANGEKELAQKYKKNISYLLNPSTEPWQKN